MYTRKNLNELLQQASISTQSNLSDKTLLLRSCLNLTINSEGKIEDITRLTEAYPTIENLAQKAKKVIVLAHMGRPSGPDPKLSLEPVYRIIQTKLNEKGITSEFVKTLEDLPKASSKVCVLENIRFFNGEESENEDERNDLINKLSAGVDYFVNDAFPDYRESVSTYYITKHFKSFLGHNMLKEVKALSTLNNAEHPYVAIIGGSKLSEKIDILLELAKTTDTILLGGALAYTFLKAQGINIGISLFEPEKVDVAKEILARYGSKIVLPIDHKICDQFNETSSYSSSYTNDNVISESKIAIDIGPQTKQKYSEILGTAKTILINGPMGVYEWVNGIEGTKIVYEAALSNKTAYKVLGGGDSIATVNTLKLKGFDHISTGGGAMLAILSKNKFPTLDIILDQYDN